LPLFSWSPNPLVAHHSATSYDREHPITLTGTVTEFQFTNPHGQLLFEVEVRDESGNVEKWTALSAPPQRLYRSGWNRNTLKPGDRITITGAPHKQGRKELGVVKLVGPTGQELILGAE